uniref:PIN domain-containing protein n=1 Tax=Candidatus Kentrum sp. DK TaxID=2126562 RepID=A0A450RYM5_9GAMM|nr:MAG: hypothetical protein BECKDK2373C_GA0170839_100810 [Candidatus Kentron sp. DK]
MRLVIDTNVYVSALLKETGKPASVVEYAARGTKIIASPETWNEFVEVIGRPKFKPYVSRERVAAFSGLVYRGTTMVSPRKKHFLSPDPKDNKFIDAAVEGRADAIVSGDRRHLLSLGRVMGIPVVSEPYAKVRPAPAMRQKRDQNAQQRSVNSAFSPVFAGRKGTIRTFA